MGLSSAVGHRSSNSLCHADGCNTWGPIGGPQGDNVCIQPSVSLGRLSGKCPHAFPELIAWENGDLKLCASCACTARIATNINELMSFVHVLCAHFGALQMPFPLSSIRHIRSMKIDPIRFITSVLLEIGVFQYNIYIYIHCIQHMSRVPQRTGFNLYDFRVPHGRKLP